MRSLIMLATVSALLVVPEAGASLRLSDGSHIRMEIMEGRAEIFSVLHLANDGEEEITGALLRLPRGATDFRPTEGVSLDPTSESAILAGPFSPGMKVVRLRFALPTDGDRLDFFWRPDLPMNPISAILPELPGMQAKGDSVVEVRSQEAEGLRLAVIDLLPRGGVITFSLQGLPMQRRIGSWLSLSLFTLVVFVGIFILLGAPTKEHSTTSLDERREGLLEELIQLDIDKREGLIDEDEHATDREAIIRRLASVLRDLEEAKGS